MVKVSYQRYSSSNAGQLRREVNECREKRTEKTEGGQPDAERIDGQGAGEVLPGGAPGAAGTAGVSTKRARSRSGTGYTA